MKYQACLIQSSDEVLEMYRMAFNSETPEELSINISYVSYQLYRKYLQSTNGLQSFTMYLLQLFRHFILLTLKLFQLLQTSLIMLIALHKLLKTDAQVIDIELGQNFSKFIRCRRVGSF